MNLEKVIFGFFVLLAATLNFGFFIGDISVVELHNQYELFGALVVSILPSGVKANLPPAPSVTMPQVESARSRR